MNCSETALDVLTRAATLVETDAKISLASRLKCEDLKRTSSAPVSPVDLRDSPSKELPTRIHKLKRTQLRRELAAKDNVAKKSGSPLDHENQILRQSLMAARDESSASDMDQQSSGGDEDPLDEDDQVEDLEDGGGGDDDDDDDVDEEFDVEDDDEDEDDDVDAKRRRQLVVLDEDDGPLDMTTGNRGRGSRDASSASPSPPLCLAPSFCANPPLLYSPFASAAPPPPYHPLPPPLHYQHGRSTTSVTPHQRRASPPPPPYFASKANGVSSVLANGKANGGGVALLQQHRPSVITCAPALAGRHRALGASAPVVNRRSLSDPTPAPSRTAVALAKGRRGSDVRHGHRREIWSAGMCDPVIDEHFRRSLGKDYPEFLAASSSSSSSTSAAAAAAPSTATPATTTTISSSASISITGMSVDDHFAKALGDTWLRLQGKMAPSSTSCSPTSTSASPPSSPVAASISAKAPSPPPPPFQPQRANGLLST